MTRSSYQITRQRQHVRHCHDCMVAWARSPESVGMRAFAVAHYAQHKARALLELQIMLNT